MPAMGNVFYLAISNIYHVRHFYSYFTDEKTDSDVSSLFDMMQNYFSVKEEKVRENIS